MTSPTDESREPPGNGPAKTGAEVRAIVTKMYAPPPRGPILPSVWGWIARNTVRVIDWVVAGYLAIAAIAGAGPWLHVMEAQGWGSGETLFLLCVFPFDWFIIRLGYSYSVGRQRIKELKRSVESLEFRERLALEEIEDLKEQLRECGQQID